MAFLTERIRREIFGIFHKEKSLFATFPSDTSGLQILRPVFKLYTAKFDALWDSCVAQEELQKRFEVMQKSLNISVILV